MALLLLLLLFRCARVLGSAAFLVRDVSTLFQRRDKRRSPHFPPQEVMRLGAGQYWGEHALKNASARRAATVTARGNVKLLAITRARFEEMFGPLAAIEAARTHWQDVLR